MFEEDVMKRLMIIGLWPDDVVKYCTEKCDCRRYAFDRILYHRGGRDAREPTGADETPASAFASR